MRVQRSALVAHPASRIFGLIEAAEDYPAFLPWCASATILHRDDSVVVARIEVAWHGVRFGFVTRNPKRSPEWMAIGLEEGPFRHFRGEWHLTPLAAWGSKSGWARSRAGGRACTCSRAFAWRMRAEPPLPT